MDDPPSIDVHVDDAHVNPKKLSTMEEYRKAVEEKEDGGKWSRRPHDGTANDSKNMRCPLCNTVLSEGSTHCTYCDWIRPTVLRSHTRDWIAAGLSFVPGLGHLYKGHLVPGILLLCVFGPLYLILVFWLVPKTYGASLLLPAVFVIVVGHHAYHLRDVRGPEMGEMASETLRRWQARLKRRKEA
jgi:hypothetical protein